MAARELVFDILAIDRASAVFDRVAGKAEVMGGKVESGSKIMQGALLGAGLAVAAMAVESIKTAATMETQMNRIVSTGGETEAGMRQVWAGIDVMAGKVGTSVTKLADAMYYVEGAGFHGANALTVLTAAAKGAKVEMADTTDVARAVGGALADYNMKASQAASVTNAMLTAVGHGQTSFEEFAKAFPKVGSRAASANVTLNETLSAMSRMTRDGLPAAVAATYLGQTIGHLAAPTGPAVSMMDSLGISVIGVQKAIISGSGHGLGDAIQMLYNGIMQHLTPAGLVAFQMFKKSKGTISDFQKVLANLPPEVTTTVGALAQMSGGVKGFQGILMLGNDHLKGYKDTLAAVNATVKRGGQNIEGFDRQQKSLNGILDDAKGKWSGLSDALGRQLLPYVKEAALKLGDLIGYLGSHEAVVQAIVDTVGALAVAFGVVEAAVKAYTVVQWLLNASMDANPIGLIILGLGALTYVIIDAYQHSDTFRKVVTVALDAVKLGWLTLEYVVVTVVQAITQQALSWASDFLHAAVLAFGWVPGLGDKLKGASNAVDKFKDDTNASLEKVRTNLKISIDTANAQMAYDILISQMQTPVSIPVFLNTQYASGSVKVAGLGLVNAGQRAAGGPVQAGMTYRVGENGPEDVTFGANGYVHDAKTTKAGGHGAALYIDKYYEGSKSSAVVVADLMFRKAAAG